MNLKKKLILEDLEDEAQVDPDLIINAPVVETELETPTLTPEEESNFNLTTVSDILNKDLELYNFIKVFINEPNLKEDVKSVLESVADDLAISIGKLQECIKLSADDSSESLMTQGENEVEDIITEEPVKEE